MMPSRPHSMAFLITAVILLAALLIPKAALAEGEPPPAPDAPAGEVSPTTEGVQAPAPVEAQEAAPAEALPTEEAAPVSEDVAAVVELLAETDSILLDPAGEAIPLASEEAVEALQNSDPWFDAGGGVIVGYSSGGSCAAGVTECHAGTANPIQTAINDVRAAGKIINIEAGSYYENIQVTRSVTLQGAGQDLTLIYPAVSDPDTRAACEYSSCANATNTVILVSAPTVSIFDLTVNGNNPFISSSVSVGGEDIDSHNGIVTTNTVTNLTIQDVTVKNVLTRGIQYGNGVGTIDIENNKVENVQGTAGAIGIFNRYGTGTIANNQLSHVGDAIAMNWGRGVQITGNTIMDAWTGIHTDNTQGVDLISGNSMSNGKANSYGVFVFAPYNPVSVVGNSISGYDYGLTVAGNGYGDSLNTITFEDNSVGTNIAGIYLTSDVWGYFKSDVSAQFFNNTFTGGQYGMWLESFSAADYAPAYYGASDCTGDCVLSLTAYDNSFSGETVASVTYATGTSAWYGGAANYHGIYDVDASGNWWGTNDPTTLAVWMATGVDYSPWLHTGTDTLPGTPGFQGDFSSLHVDDDSAVSGSVRQIQEGIDMSSGGSLFISPGTYVEQVILDKNLSLIGAGEGLTTIQAPGTLTAMPSIPGQYAIVQVINGGIVPPVASMSNLTVAGPGPTGCGSIHYGIFVGSGATLDLHDATVTDIRDNPVSGCQNGNGIRVGTASQVGHATIDNVKVLDYQKTGIIVSGVGSTATIANSTIQPDPNAHNVIAANGIQVSSGAVAEITGNTISGNACDYAPGGCGVSNPFTGTQSAGILLYNAGGGTEIGENTISGSDIGIYNLTDGGQTWMHGNTLTGNRYYGLFLDEGNALVEDNTISGSLAGILGISFTGAGGNSLGSLSGNLITGNTYGVQMLDQTSSDAYVPIINGHGNSIYGNGTGVSNETLATVMNFTGNWWGDAGGPLDPGAGSDRCGLAINNPGAPGDGVSECVLYDPWLTTDPDAPSGQGGGDGGGGQPGDLPRTGGQQFVLPGTGGALINQVSVSGGQNVTLECTAYDVNALVLSNGDHLEIPCPISGEAQLEHDAADALPAPLPDGMSYVSAMQWGLAPNIQVVQSVDATIGVHFAIPDGQAGKSFNILHWDNGEWQKLGGLATADGYFEGSHAQTGLYAFVSE